MRGAVRRCAIEEIQFHKIKSPFVKYPAEYAAQIVLHFGMIDVQGIESGPVTAAAEHLSVMPEEPVGMFFVQRAVLFRHKRRQP